MITLRTNLASVQVQSKLRKADNTIASLYQKLSSGQRINKPSDDAAGLQISETLNARSTIYRQGIRNANDSASLLNVADYTLNSLSQIVERQKELAAQSASGALNSSQRDALQAENQGLQDEYNRILESAKYNGTSLFTDDIGVIDTQLGGDNVDFGFLLEEAGLAGTGTYTDRGLAIPEDGISFAGLIVADLDEDGIDDVVVVNATGAPGAFTLDLHVSTYLGRSDGAYVLTSQSTHTEGLAAKIQSVDALTANFNGNDNDLEVEFTYTDSNSDVYSVAKTAPIDGSGTTGVIVDGLAPSEDILIKGDTGDFNGDGITDTVNLQPPYDTLLFSTQDTEVTTYANLAQSGMDISTASGALTALNDLETLANQISKSRAIVGASLSRVEVALANLQSHASETETARSRIIDLDVASGVADLTRAQVQKDAATAILAQANQQPQIVLSLLAA